MGTKNSRSSSRQRATLKAPYQVSLDTGHGSAEITFETAARALEACRAAQGVDEAATTHREHDVLEAERQRLLEPDLVTAVQKVRIERLVTEREVGPVEAAARAAAKADARMLYGSGMTRSELSWQMP